MYCQVAYPEVILVAQWYNTNGAVVQNQDVIYPYLGLPWHCVTVTEPGVAGVLITGRLCKCLKTIRAVDSGPATDGPPPNYFIPGFNQWPESDSGVGCF
jgi:hypothetical protein